MKQVYVLLLAIGLSACAPLAKEPAALSKPGWVLTFHDEFDGDTLDTRKWGGRYTIIPSLRIVENGIVHLRIERWFPPFGPGGGNGRISGIESRNAPRPFSQKYG